MVFKYYFLFLRLITIGVYCYVVLTLVWVQREGSLYVLVSVPHCTCNYCIVEATCNSMNYVFREFNVSIPLSTRKNGTLYCHTFLMPRGSSPFSPGTWRRYDMNAMTTFAIPQAETFNLMGSDGENPKVDRYLVTCHCLYNTV